MTKVAERIGLPRTKVYKWTWDRRQQQLKDPTIKVSVKEMEELQERANRALDAYRTGETLLAKHFRQEMKALMAKVERGELGQVPIIELTESDYEENNEKSADQKRILD